MKSRSLAFTVASVVSLVACSGANSSDLFGAPTTTQSTPTDPIPDPGSSGTSGTSGSSGSSGTSGTSGTSGSSGSSGSSGTSGSSGGTNDAGADAAATWKSPGIFCGEDEVGTDVYCTGSKLCCARTFSSGSGDNDPSFECVSNGVNSCQGGRTIRCDDRSDCPSGQVCCGAFDQTFGYRNVQCATSCNSSPIPGTTPVRFCDPNAPADECTAIGKSCEASGSLTGFHVCK